MFTGLIEAVGAVTALRASDRGLELEIQTELGADLSAGDSLAVNGVCLTVTTPRADHVRADIGPETARITTLGRLRPGDSVNLERPLAGNGRFGGHFVQGHVDGTGLVRAVRDEGDSHWITIGYDGAAAACLIAKGSIAVNGVSLTVARLAPEAFDVMIIPFTWSHTNLALLRPGDQVNLEYDMVGKYVSRAVELALADRLKTAK